MHLSDAEAKINAMQNTLFCPKIEKVISYYYLAH